MFKKGVSSEAPFLFLWGSVWSYKSYFLEIEILLLNFIKMKGRVFLLPTDNLKHT